MLLVHGKSLRILSAADQKSAVRSDSRRLDKKPIQCFLTVRGIRSQIRQIGRKLRNGFRRAMDQRIHAAVERGNTPRPQAES